MATETDPLIGAAEAVEGGEAQQAARARVDEIAGSGAIGRGRPPLAGPGRRGESPKVQVRLPHDLNAALKARAAAEHRKPSEVAREAIAAYLRTPPTGASPEQGRRAS